MTDIYMANILDHYKNPRHKGKLETFTNEHEESNTSCGDQIKVYALIKDGKLEDASFEGKGCAVSQATISILLLEVIGMDVDKIRQMKKEDVLELLGIELGPVRLKCALIGLETLQKAVTN